MKVIFAPEVENDLFELVELLVRKGYFGTYDFAISYVEDLINYIQTKIHIKLKKKAPINFCIYGSDLWYITYRRNTNTTWYIFFEQLDDLFWIKYISNNHKIAHLL